MPKVTFLLLCVCLLLAGPAQAQSPRPERITLELREAPVDFAVRTVLRKGGRSFVVRGRVPDLRVTVSLRDVTPEEAVRRILRAAAARKPGVKLTVTAEDFQLYLPHAAAEPVDEHYENVTLRLVDVPLREAIDLLFHGSNLQYAVDPNVPDVRISVEVVNVSHSAALRHLIRAGAKQAPGLTSGRG